MSNRMSHTMCNGLALDWTIGGYLRTMGALTPSDYAYITKNDRRKRMYDQYVRSYAPFGKYVEFISSEALDNTDFVAEILLPLNRGLSVGSTEGSIIVSCNRQQLLASNGLVCFMLSQLIDSVSENQQSGGRTEIDAGDDSAPLIIKLDQSSNNVLISYEPADVYDRPLPWRQWIAEIIRIGQEFVRFLDAVAADEHIGKDLIASVPDLAMQFRASLGRAERVAKML